jgi:hypothetical protein
LTRRRELIVGLVFMLVSLPVFFWLIALGGASSLDGSLVLGTDELLGYILAGGLFFGGLGIVVSSHYK